MLHKLSTRLAISHALPVLILTPALAVVLIFLLETRHSVGDLADQLTGQANLVVATTRGDTDVWTNPEKAQAVVDDLKAYVPSRIMILNNKGEMMASSLLVDKSRIGAKIDFAAVNNALQNQTGWTLDYSPFMKTRILDMALPVLDDQHQVIGVVRLSYDISDLEESRLPIQLLILITFIIGAVCALALGIWLAHSLGKPLSRVSQAVRQLTPGAQPQQLPEIGPHEVQIVAVSYNQMSQRLYQLELTRRQIIANVVHELGTPLGAIKAAAEALRNGAVTDPALATDLAFGIGSQVDQLRLLIDDLALLGESEIHDITLKKQWINLEELIQTQCHSYAYLVKQKELTLTYHIANQLPPVFADPQRLYQILANLLHNAYKYSLPGGQIAVSAETEQDNATGCVLIHVSDTGPGIAPEEQARVFDLLYRSPHQRNMHKGMGIGLALSRRLAEAHGGKLSVKSEVGKGTTFTLSLPATPTAELDIP